MRKKIIGYTAGVFDLFHIGHLNILKNAKSMCDELIVSVTQDEYTKRTKGKYPIVSEIERAEIVSNIRFVDRVVFQDIPPTEDFVSYMLRMQKELGFQKVFKGSDAQSTQRWQDTKKEFDKIGVEVIFFPYTPTTSSTILTEKLSEY